MSHVTLTTTTRGFSVPVDRKGIVKTTHVNIMDYARKFVQRKFDHQQKRWVIFQEFFYFDQDQELCYFPKYDLDNFKLFLVNSKVSYSIVEKPTEPGTPVNFLMLPHVSYKNEKQKGCVEYLTNPNNGPLRAVALQTGVGKTVSVIWALQKLGVLSMITMTSRLEQWVGEFGKYTTVDEDDVYVIQGIGSLTKLFNQIGVEVKPKVILGSTKTMRMYLDYGPSYQHLPHPSEMCEKLGIGILATDEAHEHMYTNFLMSLLFNPSLFIPITATFIASDPFVKDIFEKSVPKEVQFYGGAYDRFVNYTAYEYTSGGYLIKPYHYMSPQGYSQVMFEKFLMGRGRKVLDRLIEDALIPMIKTHYINIADKGERFLLLCATTKLCDYLETVFKRVFKDKTVSTFYSGRPTTILENFDMILSTPGSAGCLAGDSIVSISRNGSGSSSGSYSCTLKNAYLHFNNLAKNPAYNWDRKITTYIRSYDGTSIRLCEVGDILYSGVKDVYRITLDNGFSIKCTSDHTIMTTNGWVQAKDVVGKYVMCEVDRRPISGNGRKRLRDVLIGVSKYHPYAAKSIKSSKGRKYFHWRLETHRAIYEAIVLNKMTLEEYLEALKNPDKAKLMKFIDSSIYDIHHLDHDHSNNDPKNLIPLEKTEHKKLHSEKTKFNFNQGLPDYSKAISIEYLGEEDTYDIHCLDHNSNFVANGIVVHNTGRDVKNLRTCLAFESSGSETRNLQFIGRLRGPPQMMNTPEFISIAFSCIPQHQKYMQQRAMLYGSRALTSKTRVIS